MEITEDDKEFFEERAAIMEYEGGLSREEAEREARKLMRRRIQRRAYLIDEAKQED
ncbi:hypothetical protein Nhal_0976 [Nitrosococcus halophilus Nc 4]|uniref:Uncharacterized protein n=1 Tax=Nitrosococcus halophilus (strain Nc4) TaxID=472759 RepID=D5BYG6_NITHN|nr:hypothetical protein [Nitrosococcus halophilus]ADE14149.1 hypothetical protein Nhal_0976 [Nitrosococcus halophilus Nc 4]